MQNNQKDARREAEDTPTTPDTPGGKEILRHLEDIRNTLVAHSNESKQREHRMFQQVQTMQSAIRRIEEKADLAHATALEAKHLAGSVSIDAEGNDHSIFAQLASVNVNVNNIATKFGEIDKRFASIETEAKEEKKRERKARIAWRTLQPGLIAVATVLVQKFTTTPTPPPPPPQPTQVQSAPVQIHAADAGVAK